MVEDGVEVGGGGFVLGGYPGPVDVEGGGGAGVAEPVGHGAQVDAGSEEFGGDEVSEPVKFHVVETDTGAESFPAAGDEVAMGWWRRGRW